MINRLPFLGCRPPYHREDLNMYIKPISSDPTEAEIKSAINATKTTKPIGDGMNGRAYFLGEDLIVKKYFGGSDKIAKEAFDRETGALDRMYDDNMLFDNCQQGKYGFTTDDGAYLVSTRVKGAKPNPKTNKFNKDNLKSMVDILYKMDTPIFDEKVTNYILIEDGKSHPRFNHSFPYKIPMHYDLSLDNIVINEKESGLIDFEYFDYKDLQQTYENVKNHGSFPSCLNYDIPGFESNLSGFESRGLFKYLEKADKNEAKKTFYDYLKLKSGYHYDRFRYCIHLIRYYSRNHDEQIELGHISDAENSHYLTLKYPDDCIKKAEAIKMQMNRWLFKQSGAEVSTEDKINPSYMIKYIEDANNFFLEQRENCGNGSYKYTYWDDCYQISCGWKELIDTFNFYTDEKPIEDRMYRGIPFKKLPEDFQNWLKNQNELFMKKITDKIPETLDKKVL